MPMTVAPRTAIGWPVLRDEQVPTHVIPVQGGEVKMRLRAGDAADILIDLVKQFDATVERVYQGQLDDWSYNRRPVRGGSSIWSEHAAGTAVDLNATQHGRGARGTFTDHEVAAIRALLDRYEGVVGWGGDFGAPGHSGHTPDEMHFQLNVPPGDPAVARVAAKIRAIEEDAMVRPKIVKVTGESRVWIAYPSGLCAYLETPALVQEIAAFWGIPAKPEDISKALFKQFQRISPDN